MSMVAWLPAFYQQLGWSPTRSGSLLAFMTLFQVLAALTIPAWPSAASTAGRC